MPFYAKEIRCNPTSYSFSNKETICWYTKTSSTKSTLLTSTATQSSTSHLGTTVFDTSDSSQIVVSNVGTDLTVEKYIDTAGNFSYNGSTIRYLKKLQIDIGFLSNTTKSKKTKKINNSKYEIVREDHSKIINKII